VGKTTDHSNDGYGSAHAEDHQYSLACAAGSYGVSESGTVIGIGPRAAVALLTLDAAGINGKVTASLNGSVSKSMLSGSYTVNPDCTGHNHVWRVRLIGEFAYHGDGGARLGCQCARVSLPLYIRCAAERHGPPDRDQW
jgi:hypothetical protein